MAFSLGEIAAEEVAALTVTAEEAGAAAAERPCMLALATPPPVPRRGGFGRESLRHQLLPSASCSRAMSTSAKGGTAQTFLANTLSNADPIPVIYGSRRVGASVIEIGLTATEIAADRLHRIAIWGEGPISAVQALYLDTVLSTDSNRLRRVSERSGATTSSTTSAPTPGGLGDADRLPRRRVEVERELHALRHRVHVPQPRVEPDARSRTAGR
jgi:hypothetical protein